MLVMVLRAMDRRRATAWMLAGFVMGVSALAKETTLLLTVITLGWVLVQYRHAARKAVGAAAWLCAGFLFCFAPLVARNLAVGAPPWATSVQGTGIIVVGLAPDRIPAGFSVPSAEARGIIHRSQGGTLAALRESLRAYPDGVWGMARHQLWKLRALVDPFEIPNNVSYYYARELSPALSLSLGYGLIFPLGAAGLLLLLKAWPRPSLFYCYLAAALGTQLMTVILARFRLAFIPVLILAGGYFCSRLLGMVRERRLPSLAGCLGLVAGIALAQQLWTPVVGIPMTLRVAEFDYSAQVYASEGRMDLAVAEIARLRSKAGLDPRYSDLVSEASALLGNYHVLWAWQLLEQGLPQEAHAHALQAQEAYLAQSRFTLWPYNLAVLYRNLNDPGKAKAFFRQFLNRAPDGPRADEARAALSELGG
jgi:tetratricopeptide (TPR) repeat protein